MFYVKYCFWGRRKATERDRYFLHSKFAFTRESFMSLPGLTGLRNNPKNCHYLVENIPTVEDINKEYLLLYPVWLLCWIWWVLACFKTATNHPSSYLEKSIFDLNVFESHFLFWKLLWKRYLDSNLAPSHAESNNYIFYKLELGVIANIESWENDFEYEYGLEVVLVLVLVVDANILYCLHW